MREITRKIMDVLFYLCLLTILVWGYLKSVGYINTPAFVQFIPYAAATFSAGMFYQRFINLERNVSQLKLDVNTLQLDVHDIKNKITYMDRDIGCLRDDVEVLKKDVTFLKASA
ncbi:hypothetical protein ACFL1B_00920 [Nanoarchaeota archaeon]